MITVVRAWRNNPLLIKTLRVIFHFFSLSLCLCLFLCVCVQTLPEINLAFWRQRLSLARNFPGYSGWHWAPRISQSLLPEYRQTIAPVVLHGSWDLNSAPHAYMIGSLLSEITSFYYITLSFLTNSELGTKKNATVTTENWIEGYIMDRQEIAFRNFNVGNIYFTTTQYLAKCSPVLYTLMRMSPNAHVLESWPLLGCAAGKVESLVGKALWKVFSSLGSGLECFFAPFGIPYQQWGDWFYSAAHSPPWCGPNNRASCLQTKTPKTKSHFYTVYL